MLFKIYIRTSSDLFITTYLKARSHKTAVKSCYSLVSQIEEHLNESVRALTCGVVFVKPFLFSRLVKKRSTKRYKGYIFKDGKQFFKID